MSLLASIGQRLCQTKANRITYQKLIALTDLLAEPFVSIGRCPLTRADNRFLFDDGSSSSWSC